MLNLHLERQRLTIVFGTIVLNAVAMLLFTRFPWSDWKTGTALVLLDNLLLIIHVLRARDMLMLRLILFGLVVGCLELVADAWIVYATGTVDYNVGGGPMIWSSPIWLPLAWQVATVQFGYIGLRLYEAMGLQGLFMAGFLGAINTMFCEEMAHFAHWWRYGRCRMLFHTPWFVIVGGFFIAMALGWLSSCARQRRGYGRIFAFSALGGTVILVSYVFSYLLIDRIWTLMR